MYWLRNLFKPAPLLSVTYDSGKKNRPTIVLIHGIAATSKTWESFIKELDEDKYRVITIDLLGFGKSPKPVNFKYDTNDHVASLRRTLRKLDIRKPYKIVGHSMGAIIAARYARHYHYDIDNLYLLGIPLYIQDDTMHNNFSKRQTSAFFKAYEFMLSQRDFTIATSQTIRKLLRIYDGIDVNETNWNSFRLSLKNTIINQNAYEDIKKIKIPTYIVYGLLDEFMVQNSIRQLENFDHVKLIKLLINDHIVNRRFAREVIKLISNNVF